MCPYVDPDKSSPFWANAEDVTQLGSLEACNSQARVQPLKWQRKSHKPSFLPHHPLWTAPSHPVAAAESCLRHLLKIQPPRSLPLERLTQWVWEGAWGF